MDHSESPIILRLKKATTELLLLSLLDEEDMYGYQLASEIKQRSHELCACKETSLYPYIKSSSEKDLVSTSNVVTEKENSCLLPSFQNRQRILRRHEEKLCCLYYHCQ